MVGPNRTVLLLVTCVSVILTAPPRRAGAEPADTPKAEDKDKAKAQSKDSSQTGRPVYALPGEDPPAPFVPVKPRTVEDRKLIEATSEYSAARALEERHELADAIGLLEKALIEEPDSVAILRRLSRLCFAVGRTAQGIEYSERALKTEPDDTDTLSRLIGFYTGNRRNIDTAAAEGLLKGVLKNPKLGKHSAGRLLAQFELGRLYANKLQKPEQAADAYAEVIDALDEKAANQLSPKDQRLVLGNDPEEAYLEFGETFVTAKRYALAIRAFERGLVYAPDHSQLRLKLAQTLLDQNQPEKALAIVEAHIKKQPQGREGYELLAKILTVLKRENEITPRLEEAARLDAQNLPLQYSLADRYRQTGQIDKAEALYKKLLEATPTPQGYAALAESLLKRKQTNDLVRVLAQAYTKPEGVEAVKETVEAIGEDHDFAEKVLDAGRTMITAEPLMIDRRALFDVLSTVAVKSEKIERFLPIQRMALQWFPTPQSYLQLDQILVFLQKFDQAADTLEEMVGKFPEARKPQLYVLLSKRRLLADQLDKAMQAARDALKIDPNDIEAQFQVVMVLTRTGKPDEAVAKARDILKNDPMNPTLNSYVGYILTQFSKNDEAITHYKGLLERYPAVPELVRAAHSGLSVVYINMGDFSKAEKELETLLDREPEDPGVNNDLGYLYADQGKNLEKAESMIRKALQDKPNESAYLDSLGWVLFKQGKLKEAAEQLEAAIKSGEPLTDATIHEHLGDVYFQMQDMAKAKSAWETAEKMAAKAVPVDKRLSEIRKKLKSLKQLGYILRPSTGNSP